MYYTDRFQKPNPSQPDITISIDAVMDRKLDALAVMESQFLEGGANGHEGLIPKNAEGRTKRVADVRRGHTSRNIGIADRYRALLKEWYGDEAGVTVKHAESFEIF
ncbi:MAG: hypothetical protein ACREEM_53210 [Blastocatellia bacterium]